MTAQTQSLSISRFFTTERVHPYDTLTWQQRALAIRSAGEDGKISLSDDMEFPEDWSTAAATYVAKHYFLDGSESAPTERSLRQLIDRVVDTITTYGFEEGYFASEADADLFNRELKYILVTQRATFDSTTWQSIGAANRPQMAASYVTLGEAQAAVSATWDWHQTANMTLKTDTEFGINLSDFPAGAPRKQLQAVKALALAVHHQSSAVAQVVGVIDGAHPDALDFITETQTAIRLTDNFMRAVVDGKDWQPTATQLAQPATDVLHQIATATLQTNWPVVQFDTTISDWNPTPSGGSLIASSIDASFFGSANMATVIGSLNLLSFLDASGQFDIQGYKQTITLMTIASEILLSYSHYPTEEIDTATREARPLGLGYQNLAALLMAKGIAYDSDAARAYATTLTAILTAQAYLVSARLSARLGECAALGKSREGLIRLLRKHYAALAGLDPLLAPGELSEALSIWDEATTQATKYGVRNAQVTLLSTQPALQVSLGAESVGTAPVEQLVSTNGEVHVSSAVPLALRALGYDRELAEAILTYIGTTHSAEAAPGLQPQHVAVLASLQQAGGVITAQTQLQLLAAVQPQLSGGIGSQFYVAQTCTAEQLAMVYVAAWRAGLKSIRVRVLPVASVSTAPALALASTSTPAQIPTSTTAPTPSSQDPVVATPQPKATSLERPSSFAKPAVASPTPVALQAWGSAPRALPPRRRARTYEFHVADCKGFMTVGEFEDGQPGELFLRIAKQGSTLGGMMDALAISVSHGLQHGVPLKEYVKAFHGHAFMPAGETDDPEVSTASSLTDYIFRRLARDYLSFAEQLELGLVNPEDAANVQQQSLLDA